MAQSSAGAPVWLTGSEAVDLHQGDAAVVPCATSFVVPEWSASSAAPSLVPFAVVPSTDAVCRACRTLWDTPEGFVLIANLSQPLVRIEPGDLVATAVAAPGEGGNPWLQPVGQAALALEPLREEEEM